MYGLWSSFYQLFFALNASYDLMKLCDDFIVALSWEWKLAIDLGMIEQLIITLEI
jgi:DNA-binding IclR family transcriptional regulator